MESQLTADPPYPDASVYSPTARRFHWWTALLVAIMLPLGYFMAEDSNPLKLTDATKDWMYSAHKLIGLILLGLIVARLYWRYRNGAPASEPTLAPWQKGVSHATHWLLYLLLITVPLGGWIGVSMFGARDIFGWNVIPPLAPVNDKLAGTVFMLHRWGAKLIFALVVLHIGAALMHYLVLKDGVVRRMLPGLPPRT